MQSQSIVSIFSKEFFSLLSLPIFADLTFLYPLATITPWENLISIPFDLASSINSDECSSLVSNIIGSTLFFLNSKAVSYALSLLVNIKGFFPTKTP